MIEKKGREDKISWPQHEALTEDDIPRI